MSMQTRNIWCLMKGTVYFLGEMEAIIVLTRMVPVNSSQWETCCIHSETIFTKQYRGPIESFITWCNENHLKLNINNELVLDYCCVSISVQALGTTVSWTVKVLECVHMFGQLSWLIEHKEQNKKTFLKKTLWNIDVSQASSSQQHRRSPQSAPFKGGHSGSVPPIQYPTKCGIW